MSQLEDEEKATVGLCRIWMWALRQPNALQLFQESGARCPHGIICAECLEEARVVVAGIVTGQDPTEA